MTLDELVKTVSRLEDEYKAMSTNTSTLMQRMKMLEDKSGSFLDTARDLKREFERVNLIFSKMGTFNESLMQVRADLTKRVDDIGNQRQLQQEARKDDFESLRKLILETKLDINPEIEKRMKVFFEEDSRLAKKVEEMEKGFNENLRLDKDFRQQLVEIIDENRRNTITLSSLEMQVKALAKLNSQVDMINASFRLLDNRLTGMQNTETQRQQEYTAFMDQQIALQAERDRIWNELTSQMEDNLQKMAALLEEGNTRQLELKRVKDEFDEITQGLSRRMNELTETYRIVEDRLRQEWNVFKGDEQKRWANFALTTGESRDSSMRKYEEMNLRLTSLEDRTREVQEALIMISTEFQKGMQSLMKTANNWIETFSGIRGISLGDQD